VLGWLVGSASGVLVLASERIDWRDFLAPRWGARSGRMTARRVVLCAQDTT
jgi:hypothetical protein